MLRLKDTPPVLFPPDKTIRQIVGPWWVAHTKARFEKAFARSLVVRKIAYFLPMTAYTIFSGGRQRHGMAVLFPSYVFFAGDVDARVAALGTNRIGEVVEVRDQLTLIEELSKIERTLQSQMPVERWAGAVVGQPRRITNGPLKGLTGSVINPETKPLFVLQISAIGEAISLNIDADSLEPA